MIKRLTESDYAVSSWSGGKTIQLAIAPEGSVYGDRDFLWRISSATVDLPESDFTALPDYDRLITPITGEMFLRHNGGSECEVPVGTIHRFDGGADTHSRGCCTDFNLMLRKWQAEGSMRRLALSAGESCHISGTGKTVLLYCVQGRATVKENGLSVCQGETLITDEEMTLEAEETAVLMEAAAEMTGE